jgi:hypothetical protein
MRFALPAVLFLYGAIEFVVGYRMCAWRERLRSRR